MTKAPTRIEASLLPAIYEAGYERLEEYIYKASWSTADVEHFIYLSEFRKTQPLLTGDFAMRNVEAEAFSVSCIRTYGGDLFRVWQHNERTSCTMHSSFGRLRSTDWPVAIGSISGIELGTVFRNFVTIDLLPKVRHVTTVDDFLSLLIADDPMFPWTGTNAAIRAAQIVVLGDKIDLSAADIRRVLENRKSWIANGLSKTSEMRSNPDLYISKIIGDWHARSHKGGKAS